MKIYAILAHHDKTSLSSSLFYSAVDALNAAGHTVDVLDLYLRANEIPFYASSKPDAIPTLHTSSFFHENKERFLAADGLIIVYPIFWYSVPGILKCWIDLITNFAWKFQKNSKTLPLHSIKKAFIINSSMEPWWYRRFLTTNPSRRQIERTFDFMGIADYHFYEIGNAHALTEEKKLTLRDAIIKRSIKIFQ